VREQRLKASKQKSPWIQKLTEKDDEYLGRPMNDLEVAEEIISTLCVSKFNGLENGIYTKTAVSCRFAGSGTTSSTLAFLVYAVTADRSIYSRLKAELYEAFPYWPRDESALPEVQRIQQLPYLNAVISESLRRFPTIPGAMPRRVVSSLKVGDLELPQDVSQDDASDSTLDQ
jgi:cytochrome P450